MLPFATSMTSFRDAMRGFPAGLDMAASACGSNLGQLRIERVAAGCALKGRNFTSGRA